ncbi:hypothetical protein ACFQGT_04610 [Natrialbaceae archaeon GCM10025810]|uniref:hypothetical protein n=1 Tax=Halovalidus salilacus TaxID=3075124 RepID=UPI00361039C7
MHDVIPTTTRSERNLLAVSFALFGLAGVTTTAVDSLGPTLGATASAVAGVYCVARYAETVSRRSHARLSLGLWIAFLVASIGHAVGLRTVASATPGPDDPVVVALTALTWMTLLSACAATAFLAFREYSSPAVEEAAEERVLDGKYEY